MSRLKELIKGAPIHERRLVIQSYPVNDGGILVEGWLRDVRLVKINHWDGHERQPGVVHWMCVRLLLGGWPLTIQDAEAEMPGIPHELCHENQESVKKVIGVKIVSGYSNEIRRLLGGTNGCTHLTHLIVTMGPAALHGFWTRQAQNPLPEVNAIEEIPDLPYLINSCYLWREDGPLIEKIKKELAGRSSKGKQIR